ncbi:GNAT family N-acetyltransferase [Amycolatopsis alkalitolerans]|uniref:GNAT family N-acetyltransferase n=1 Tax=Amycolatopsis alkalitolerans TaxID=2547244 RepID=A0A5C4M170_9PSEU|nr:GNAT family N-acetyltransferase [Amycolatopsis alkalitolerans]TNC25453.1 GNAT family N-acetyltransferase [Amycolatopsis alkalitolerans]
MTDFEIRLLSEGEQRATHEMLGRAFHDPRLTDEEWERLASAFPADRKFGAFDGDAVIGAASSFGTELAVPGGKAVPAAAVDGVGVRPDRTRRGVATALMHAQLRDCADRGEVVAYLRASEATIYGRFGYGVSARWKSLRIDTSHARFRDDAPAGGTVRLLEPDEAHELLPALYDRIGLHRPGMIARTERWWSWGHPRMIDEHVTAVHSGPDGDDGFVLYKPHDRRTLDRPEAGVALLAADLHAANLGALVGLWRFLLGVDLVGQVVAYRPLDEPIGLLLTDPRACEVTRLEDNTWLRVLDVPAALAARAYGQAAPVVIEFVDPLLAANSGRYRISPDGAERTGAPAGLRLGPEAFGMLYLGDRAPSLLAALGRVEVLNPAALPAADRLFETPLTPHCGTRF